MPGEQKEIAANVRKEQRPFPLRRFTLSFSAATVSPLFRNRKKKMWSR
jgi:hypothetical protein